MGGACKNRRSNLIPKIPIQPATMKGKWTPTEELVAATTTNFKLLKKLVFLNNNYTHYIKLPYHEVRITDTRDAANNLIYFEVAEKDMPIQLKQVAVLISNSIAGIPPSKESMKRMNAMWSSLTESAGLQKDNSMDSMIGKNAS